MCLIIKHIRIIVVLVSLGKYKHPKSAQRTAHSFLSGTSKCLNKNFIIYNIIIYNKYIFLYTLP